MFRAVSAKHSVHYVENSTGTFKGQPGHNRLVGDVAAGRGVQQITISRGAKTGHATIRVIHSTAYLRGDAFTLHTYMEIPAAQATALAGRWIAIPRTSPAYAPLAADVTFASFRSDLLPQHHLSVVNGTIGATKVTGLHGTSHAGSITVTETVYAPASKTPLPIEVTQSVHGANPATARTTLSRWNEAVRVAAPAHAIPA